MVGVVSGVRIQRNAVLEQFDALPGVTCVGSSGLRVEGNPSLLSLGGFSGIDAVQANIWIQNNSSLVTLDGLAGLSRADTSVIGRSNNSLINAGGIAGLESVGQRLVLSLAFNGSLESLGGFN